MSDLSSDALRRRMVEATIAARGIDDPRVLGAIGEVPRHLFVPEQLLGAAYDDAALPIGQGQTISEPYVVALMCQAVRIEPRDRVLEIGTGSGYSAAVLSKLASEVITVERHEPLANAARERLARLGCSSVTVHCADGTRGWPAGAPYDAIVVTAGSPGVPEPLLAQLAEGGRLIIPIGDREAQVLTRVSRRGEEYFRESLSDVRFVPLIGAIGWSDHELVKAPQPIPSA